MSNNHSFLTELKRRKVYRTAVAYVATTLAVWGAIEIASGAFGWTGRVLQSVIVVSVAGLPVALLAAWIFEIRLETDLPRGTVRRSKALALGLAAGVAVFLVLGTTIASAIDPDQVGEALLTPTDGSYPLAVLFFEDRTPERTLGHVTDAITVDLIADLRGAGLEVVSETGVENFRGSRLTPDSIARLLGVAGLVEGWLEQDGSRVSVGTRLIDGRDGATLISVTHETSVTEITELRDRTVAGVARLVRRGIGRNVRLEEQRVSAPSTDAWLSVARADRLMREASDAVEAGDVERVEESLEAAEAELEDARANAPNWSEPVTRLAWVAYEWYVLLEGNPDELLETLDLAVEHADAALAIDPEDLDAYEARGTATYRRWLTMAAADESVSDSLLSSARGDLERVLATDSLDATANSTLSHLLDQIDDWAGAVVTARRSYYSDPYLRSQVGDGVLWRIYKASYDLNAYDDATVGCMEGRKAFPQDFRFVQCQLFTMTMPGATPDPNRAWELHAEIIPLLTERPELFEAQSRMVIGGILGLAGLADSANVVFEGARLGVDLDPERELVAIEGAMRSVISDVEGSIALLERFMVTNPNHAYPRVTHHAFRRSEF